MLKQIAVTWLVVAVAIAITAGLMPSVEIDGGVLTLLGISLVFGLVNAIVGPLLHLLALPLTVVTFGLFALVVNAALLGLSAALLDSFDVGGFFPTVVAALAISVLTTVLWFVVARLVPDPEPAA
jgi:putative membrane protein